MEVTPEMKAALEKQMTAYLEEYFNANASDALREKVKAENKTVAGAYKFIESVARAFSKAGCFSIVRKPGLCDVGERVNVTLADEPGLTWGGVAECFGVTPQSDGRAVRVVYDFEKVGDAKWLKRNRQ